jgi:6-phosphofructokinase 1
MDRIRRLAVVTSGADSPGQNAAVRAVVRMALSLGWEAWGVEHGFEGLVRGDLLALNSRSVSGIIGQGGSFLGSSRSDALTTPRALREALRNLNETGMDALVVIGGDGSMRGALALYEAGFATVGVPATIENDVCGTDLSIGVDTALNTALDALDRIRDTASSHQQAFVVEMAGEKSGYLALMAGLAGGAEMVCIPEAPFTLEQVAREVADAYVRGKQHCIITVAEGAQPHAAEIAAHLAERREETGFEAHLTTLGHIQRGGSPLSRDRVLATRLGAAAVAQLCQSVSGVLVGLADGQLAVTPLAEVTTCTRGVDEEYTRLASMMAR